jgi:hypothetical protein
MESQIKLEIGSILDFFIGNQKYKIKIVSIKNNVYGYRIIN